MGPLAAQSRTPTGLRSTAPYPNLSGLYIGPRAGMGYYGGDAEAANIRRSNRPGYGAELSWQTGAHMALVADYFKARYPRIQDEPTLQTVRLLTRYTLTHGWFDPYFLVGGHATLGGTEDAYGPVGGIGIAIRLAPWVHLYNEISVNFSFPDGALDNQVGGSGFDVTGGLALGLRFRGLGGGGAAPVRPPLTSTTAAPPAEPPTASGDPVVFDDVNLPNPAPLTAGYTWVVASLPDRAQAESTLADFRKQGYEGQIVPGRVGGALQHRVTLGRYRNRAEAGLVRANLPEGTWLLYTTFEAPAEAIATRTQPAPQPEPVAVEPEPEPVAVERTPEPVAVEPKPEPVAVEPTSEPEPEPEPLVVDFEPPPAATRPPSSLPGDPVSDPPAQTQRPVQTPTPRPAATIRPPSALPGDPVSDPPAQTPTPRRASTDRPATALPGDPVPDPPAQTPTPRRAGTNDTFYTLVVASLSDRGRAEAELRTYERRGYSGQILDIMNNGQPSYRVTLGWYASRAAALAARANIRTDNWILAVVGPPPVPEAAPDTADPAPVDPPDEPVQQNPAPALDNGYYTWVVGVFGEQAKAETVLNEYTEDGYTGQLVKAQKDGRTLYRVTLGRYSSPGAADTPAAAARLPMLPHTAWLLFVE